MLIFTLGQAHTSERICTIGAGQVPYFRTQDFSDLMLEDKMLIKQMAKVSADARTKFITGSGTAVMGASVTNVFNKHGKGLVVNCGSLPCCVRLNQPQRFYSRGAWRRLLSCPNSSADWRFHKKVCMPGFATVAWRHKSLDVGG